MRHIDDWAKISGKEYSQWETEAKELVGQWMDHEWTTVVFGQRVQGKLKQVNYACDVVFTLDVEQGNKTLHIEGPFEEFLPASEVAE